MNAPQVAAWKNKATGYHCEILDVRGSHLCGYVHLPVGHALHGKHYRDEIPLALSEDTQIEGRGPVQLFLLAAKSAEERQQGTPIDTYFSVHGGVTYSQSAGKDDPDPSAWVFGFDCGHYTDTREKCNETYVTDQLNGFCNELEVVDRQLKTQAEAKPPTKEQDLYAALQAAVECLHGVADDIRGANFGGECDNCDQSPCADSCTVTAIRRIVDDGRAALDRYKGEA